MLIQISDSCHVAVDQIEEVSAKDYDRGIFIRMKNGIEHHLGNDYRRSSYETQRRLVSEINRALDRNSPAICAAQEGDGT